MKFFREGKASSRNIDTPGRFTTPHAGENQIGRPELHRHLESATFEYKASLNKDVHSTNPFVTEKLRIGYLLAGLPGLDGLINSYAIKVDWL